MTDLSRSLLSAARDGLQPDAAAMARVRARVAAIAAAPIAPASPAQAAADATKVASVATKPLLVAGASIVGLVGVVIAIAVVQRRVAPSSAPGIEIAVRATSTETVDPRLVVHTAPVAAPPAARPPSGDPLVAAMPATHEVSIEKSRPTSRRDAAAGSATLTREVELVDRAMLHLRHGAPNDALAELAIYRRETHGQGQLAEDAAAIDIEARCRLGRDVADILAAFDRRWPSSAQRARLMDACER
jgi:hypothetical protein